MSRFIFTLPVLALISACASAPGFDPTHASFGNAQTEDLCQAYGNGIRKADARVELEKRQVLSAADWASIDAHKAPQSGQSSCFLFASYPSDESWSGQNTKYDAKGRVIEEDRIWECSKKVMPAFCPASRYRLRNGSIQSITKLNHGQYD